MTLDTCIKRYEIWASDDRISPDIREEHKQIVKWLNNYKKLSQQDTVPFDFELYQAGLMDLPSEIIGMLDKIRDEILEYIDDLDIAAKICDIFDRYTGRLKQEEK